jgi:hypothetical protein
MKYADMNTARWASYLPVFKNVLRPKSVMDPVADMDEECADAITSAREEDPTSAFGDLGDDIIDLVFDGYSDWFSYQDEWILANLGQVLDDEGRQEDELLSGLDRIVGADREDARQDALKEFLSTAEQIVSTWRTEAAQNQYVSGPLMEGETERAVAVYENTDSWNYSRTPGTYYYKYIDKKYFFNDDENAEPGAWKEMLYWDNLAATAFEQAADLDSAEGYGPAWKGWRAIPVAGQQQGRYGGAHVYGKSADGPWVSYEAAIAEHGTVQPAAATPEQPQTAAEQQQNAMETAQQVVDEIVSPAMTRLQARHGQLLAGLDAQQRAQLEALIETSTAQQLTRTAPSG